MKRKKENTHKNNLSFDPIISNDFSKNNNEEKTPQHKKAGNVKPFTIEEKLTYSNKYKSPQISKSNRNSGKGFKNKNNEKSQQSDNIVYLKQPKIIANITNIIKEIKQDNTDSYRNSYHKKIENNNCKDEIIKQGIHKKENIRANKFVNMNINEDKYESLNDNKQKILINLIEGYDNIVGDEIRELEKEEQYIKNLI